MFRKNPQKNREIKLQNKIYLFTEIYTLLFSFLKENHCLSSLDLHIKLIRISIS